MALLINILVKGASKLLHGVNQDLLAFAIHLKALGEGVCLALDQSLARHNHKALDLVRVNIHLTRGLIVRLENTLVFL